MVRIPLPRSTPIHRRRFLALLPAAIVTSTLAQTGRKYRVGLLTSSAQGTFLSADTEEFLRALANLGYVRDRNLEVVEMHATESWRQMQDFARQIVRRQVDVIVTDGTPSTRAAQEATRTVPIAASVGDPVSMGFARDLRAPGGNITGVCINSADVARKQIELLRAFYPKMPEIAIVHQKDLRIIQILVGHLSEAAREASIKTLLVPYGNDSGDALKDLKRRAAPGAILLGDADFANAIRLGIGLVTIGSEQVDAGALAAIESAGMTSEMAGVVDRILRGSNPASTPFMLPTRYRVTVNRKTAAALHLRLSDELVLRVDRWVE